MASSMASNPVFSDSMVDRLTVEGTSRYMTRLGSIVKTVFAMLLVMLSGALAWKYISLGDGMSSWFLLSGISFSAFIVAMVIIFGGAANVLTVGLYAALEGVILGLVSGMYASYYDGIVTQAILMTIAILMAMLILYSTRLVRVDEKMRSVLLIMTLGVMMYLLLEFFIGLFIPSFVYGLQFGPWGVFISAIIVLVAALNLLLDFDFIDRGVSAKLPKKAEWYAAFGLMVTLIWLYLSILRLIAAARR